MSLNNFEIDICIIRDKYIGKSKIINKKVDLCLESKEKLSICMKNSDDNIIVCQKMRDLYESCIEKILRLN